MYISTFDELVEFCERVSSSGVLAVDTEFLREKTYHPKLCLIQVATDQEAAAIDPLLIDDLEPLRALMADETKTKVFHACGQDIEVLEDCFGFVPRPLFDTQLAAAFLGHRMQLGLAALVREYEGVSLAKADGLTDWSKRPLDEDQLRYAEEDVIYLPAIYNKMIRRLVELDRLSWIEPEIESMVTALENRRDPEEAFRHLKRATSLTRRQLAVAREVCAWRERSAERRNLPRKWVLSDEVIVELCKGTPHTPARLRRIRGTEQLSDKDVRQLIEAIRAGCSCRPEDYPRVHHRPRISAEADSIVDLMYAMLRLCSERCGVALPLIATREDLHALAAGKKSSPLLEGWRYEEAGKQLQGLLSGEMGLTIKDGHVEVL